MAKKEREVPSTPKPSNAWMATFSDLLALMLTFFVLLLSMSSLDQEKLKEIVKDGTEEEVPTQNTNFVDEMQKLASKKELDVVAVEWNATGTAESTEKNRSLVDDLLDRTGLKRGGFSEVRPEGLMIHIDGSLSFVGDTDQLTPAARLFLTQFAKALVNANVNLLMETYAEPASKWDGQEQSWNLALRRADTVAQTALQAGLEAERLRIMGYGHAAGKRDGAFLRQPSSLRLWILSGEDIVQAKDLDPMPEP